MWFLHGIIEAFPYYRKMGWSSMRWFLAAAVLAMTVGGAAAIDCEDAVAQLLPCSDFLKNKTGTPSTVCCAAAQSLDKAAKASEDYRKMLCQCLKDIAISFPINVVKTKQLPKICRVSNNVKFDPNAECQPKSWV